MRAVNAARRAQRTLLLAPRVEVGAMGAADGCSSSSSARSQAGAAGPSACDGLDRQLATAAGGDSSRQPWPWPAASHRALHCAGARQHTAAMPAVAEQEQEQEEAVPDAAASAALDAASAAGAAAASALSGAAAQLALGDPFLRSLEVTQGPAAAYKAGRVQGLFRKDERQEATILQLQRVYDDLQAKLCRGHTLVKGRGLTLLDAAPEPGGGWLSGWLRGSSSSAGGDARSSASPVRGLYMYGGVGVGKTMLMDLLATTAPPFFQLERTHFHDFMLGVHQRLRHCASLADPLARVADSIADKTSVLCLDEFFVTDVADAMILHRLFGRLWDRGLVLVATSNRHPDALYEGGLQRNLFLPFIERLKGACEVHDMASRTDYRRLASHHRGLYFVTPSRDEELYERFLELANGQPVQRAHAEVAMGRHLEIPRAGGCAALFTFEELCDRPLGAADYIALANARHTLALSGVPVFTAANRTAAYRFVTLVDVLYEHRVRFLCSAEAMPFELFEHIRTQAEARQRRHSNPSAAAEAAAAEVVDDNLGFAKDRAISRLTEMQSLEYLRAHAKAHAPELLLALEESKAASKSGSSSSGGSSGSWR